MHKFFISEEEYKLEKFLNSNCFQISHVLRMRIGDLVVIGYNFKNYLVSLTLFKKDFISFQIEKELDINNEININVSVILGIPKKEKLETIIKHGTELGVYDFYPVIMKRCNNINYALSKNKRLNDIAKEASEQSFRNIVPNVYDVYNLDKIDFSIYDHIIVCYEEYSKDKIFNFKECIKKIDKNDKICFVIGPEGGITQEEIEFFNSKNALICGLTKTILRTETVIFFLMSSLIFEKEL